MSKYLAVALFLFIYLKGQSQQDLNNATWRYLDSSMISLRTIRDIEKEVKQLTSKALTEKSYFNAARCYQYQVQLADLRTEDSFYFRNSWVLDSVLQTKGTDPALQLAMHVLMAKRIHSFRYHSSGDRISYSWKKLPINYAGYEDEQLDSMVSRHFNEALRLADEVKTYSLEEVMWLSTDPGIFFFKPGIKDIVMAEHIGAISSPMFYDENIDELKPRWITLSQDAFIEKLDSIPALDILPGLRPFALYRQWLQIHRNNPAAYYYIETLARIFFSGNAERPYITASEYENEEEYVKYLEQLLLSPYSTVKTHAVYQLSRIRYTQSQRYFKDEQYREWNHRMAHIVAFDTTYRYHAVKTLKLLEQHAAMLDSFNYVKNRLQLLEKTIRLSSYDIMMPDISMSREPILAELTYKNIDQLHYRIVRRDSLDRGGGELPDRFVRRWLKFPVQQQQVIDIPATGDYNNHRSLVKIEPLPPGRYAMLFSSKPFADTSAIIETVLFDVTSIAAVNHDHKLFVLDRKTGMPLKDAVVKTTHMQPLLRKINGYSVLPVQARYVSNEKGYVQLPAGKQVDWFEVIYKGDTLREDISVNRIEPANTKLSLDDKVDKYMSDMKAYVYTDRAIYRPGQVVHFKAIFSTLNHQTGNEMLATKASLGMVAGKSVYDAWIKDNKPMIILTDAFDKNIDTIRVKLNEFGSMSGSFRIPKKASTGRWRFEGVGFDISYSVPDIKVEEYKRPAYEITITEPKGELSPKDSFSFLIKLRSFAGADLSNARVKYRVERESLKDLESDYRFDTLISATGFTNAKGELSVMINDTALAREDMPDSLGWTYVYLLYAESVDETGESHEASTQMVLSTRPMELTTDIDRRLDRSRKMEVNILSKHQLAGYVDKDIAVTISRKETTDKVKERATAVQTDQWIYTKQQLQQWFPQIDFDSEEKEPAKTKVFSTVVRGNKDSLLLDPALLTPGQYTIEMVCRENGRITGTNTEDFDVYDLKEKKLSERTMQFNHLVENYLYASDTLRYVHGNSETPVYSIYELMYSVGKNKVKKEIINTVVEQPGVSEWSWKLPEGISGNIQLKHLYILNNEVYESNNKVYVSSWSTAPEIVVEKWRNKMAPGDKETFVVSIKSKDIHQVAELATAMYDATLDKLEEHDWIIPYFSGHEWTENWRSHLYYYSEKMRRPFEPHFDRNIDPGKPMSFFWMGKGDVYFDANTSRYLAQGFYMMPGLGSVRGGDWKSVSYYADRLDYSVGFGGGRGLTGDLNSYSFSFSTLQQKNFMGLRTLAFSPSSMTDSVVTTAVPFLQVDGISIQGRRLWFTKDSKLKDFIQPIIYLDGKRFTGDINSIDLATLKSGAIFTGADAGILYGHEAGVGVLVLSTSEELILFPPDPPPPLRKNFNETAFFFPAIYAGKDSLYSMSFTMPESVTEWKWLLLAHTKDAEFATLSEKLTTQLPLMVQPNMPRILYQGDRIVLKSRISNLDSLPMKGKLICKVEDLVTGEDLTATFIKKQETDFSVEGHSNSSAGIEIRIPENQLNPLKISVAGRSGNFSDGEEHVVPVLSTGVFVRQFVPFDFAGKDTSINIPGLPADAKAEGWSITMRPQPQAAILDALPYLSNYPHGCAEQLTNKLYSYLTAIHIMRNDVNARRAYQKAKAQPDTSDNKEDLIPGELQESVMPWLNLRSETKRRQEKLMQVLDTVKAGVMIEEVMKNIYALQQDDGGLSWFPGGKSDEYISNYVLRSFGQMKRDSLLDLEIFNDYNFDEFTKELWEYCSKQFLKEEEVRSQMEFLYAQSYWRDEFESTPALLSKKTEVLKKVWVNADKYSLAKQALLITVTLRGLPASDSLYKKAALQLRSINQLAIIDERNGIRWKEMADDNDLCGSAEETIVLLAEAFAITGDYKEVPAGIVKWLISSKMDHEWNTTKSTAAVIRLIGKEAQLVDPVQTVTAKAANRTLTITNDPFRGSLQSYTEAKAMPPAVSFSKGNSKPVAGYLNWYYFSKTPFDSDIKLTKELSRWNEKENKWEAVGAGTVLQTGERIRVALTIQSARTLQYVYITDSRSGAFEPADNSSGYEYAPFAYYKSVRDAGFHFFANTIPSGKQTIYYEMKASQQGSFSNGMAVLQCMYKPEISAYSNALQVEVK